MSLQDFCKGVMSQLISQWHRHNLGYKKHPTELMWEHGGHCLLRPVRADQSGLTRVVLKKQALSTDG